MSKAEDQVLLFGAVGCGGLIALVLLFIFPILFIPLFAVGVAGGVKLGVNFWKKRQYVYGLSTLSVTAIISILILYGIFQVAMKRPNSDSVDWEREKRAEEWLSDPENREHFNDYMRENKR